MQKRGDLKTCLLILLPILLLVTGQLSTKKGALLLATGHGDLLFGINIFIIVGYLCLLVRGVVWIFVLRKVDLSFAYPFLSISFVAVLFMSNALFGEEISINKIFGTILIVAGVIAIGFSGSRGSD